MSENNYNPSQVLPLPCQVAARQSDWNGSVELFVFKRFFRTVSFAEDVILRSFPEEEAFSVSPRPTLRLEGPDVQKLMDDLWNAGIRPSNGVASTGQIAATEKHLADLRSIAFHLLKIGGSK